MAGHLGAAEAGHVVPDPLQGLLVVAASPGCVADKAGRERSVAGERCAEARELGPAVPGVLEKGLGGDGEAAVPLDRAAQPAGRVLDRGRTVAGIQDQGLDVSGELDRAVDVRLDVVVERVRVVGFRQLDQGREARRDTEVLGLRDAVRAAEGGAVQSVRRQAQMGRAEAWRAADSSPPKAPDYQPRSGRRPAGAQPARRRPAGPQASGRARRPPDGRKAPRRVPGRVGSHAEQVPPLGAAGQVGGARQRKQLAGRERRG